MRDYQLTGLNWLSRRYTFSTFLTFLFQHHLICAFISWYHDRNVILADEMGLGKTLQTISLMGFLAYEQRIPGPFLIVAPLSTLPAWRREFEKWMPDIYVVEYTGDAKSRRVAWAYDIQEPNLQVQQILGRGRRSAQVFRADVLLISYEIVLKDRE